MPLFERDRYQRLPLDISGGGGRRPSSFWSSASIFLLVGLCLVGAWMMASPNNDDPLGASQNNDDTVRVTPRETNKPEAKEEDRSIDFTNSVKGTGDMPKAKEEAGDTGKKDGGPGVTPETTDDAAGTGNKGGDGGATQTTDAASSDANQSSVAETMDPTANSTAGDKLDGHTVAGGETASSNQTFSDENGMTEGGNVARPEDPDRNAEKSAEEEAATGAQPDKSGAEASTDANNDSGGQTGKNAEQNTEEAPRDTGDQTDNNSGNASANTTEAAGQDEKNAEEAPAETKSEKNGEETPAYSKEAGDDGAPKNQTAFDDQNGNLEGDKLQPTDDVNTAGGASMNQTFAATDGTTTSGETEKAGTSNSTATEEEKAANGDTTELLNETAAQTGAFPTQAAESRDEKSARHREKSGGEPTAWKLCNASAGADYIPCLDNEAAIRALPSTKHYEHRERHCPSPSPSCLVPLPAGYRRPIPWPHSRDRIWYQNVPHMKLASYKGHQNWVKVSGEYLAFPGGGTQFPHGAPHYIDLIQRALPEVAWGRRSRVVLDVGCGVASFGGYLFDRDALTMSFAPKDEHEAQVQFALERGVPAVSAVMGTRRLPFPGGAFDLVHCARCRVPWHIEGGKLLLELNRLLRPGGLFVWSATPVYRKDPDNVEIWRAMAALTKAMCWDMVKKTSDTVDQTAMVIFKKPSTNDCYTKRTRTEPPLCEATDDPNAAWNITLQSCMHRVADDPAARGSRWPDEWPERLTTAPYWLSDSQTGVYGKPAPEDFAADYKHWTKVVNGSYLTGMGTDWKNVRNVMDMRSVYGGFAAALRDMKVWVMNVVPVDSPDTLPIIYDRGLFGMYHDWCESFSTYPRTYDLLHADRIFSRLKGRCDLLPVVAEVDRILRPEGTLIVRDDEETVEEVQRMARSLHWEVTMTASSKQGEGLLCVKKTKWRPTEVEVPPS